MITGNGNGYWQNLLWQYPGLFDHDFNGFGGDEFTDVGGGDSSNDEPYSACTDRKADTQAATFNSKLATKPDANIREYGAILWQDSAGNVHMTDLFPGDINLADGRRSLPFFTGELLAEWGVPSVGSIVGVIHNHPTHLVGPGWTVGAPRNIMDLASLPSVDDWNASFNLRDRGASEQNFTMYISYDGAITEFDLRENINVDRVNSGAGRGVASNGYNPGQSCP